MRRLRSRSFRLGAGTALSGVSALLALLAGVPVSAAEPGDLRLTKLGMHLKSLGPSFHPGCTLPSPLVCDDNYFTPSNIVGSGEINKTYYVYLIAFDVDRSAGLASASFRLEYDASLYIDSELGCGGRVTYDGDWPASGSGLTISFDACVGTTPDPNDPEGDGTVVLAVLDAYATAPGRAAFGSLNEQNRSAELTSCTGETTQLHWQTEGDWFVALGEAGFGETALNACDLIGAADDLCDLGVSWTYGCCDSTGTGCAPEPGWVSRRACASVGGRWQAVPCMGSIYGCRDAQCTSTPTRKDSWGRIKVRY